MSTLLEPSRLQNQMEMNEAADARPTNGRADRLAVGIWIVGALSMTVLLLKDLIIALVRG